MKSKLTFPLVLFILTLCLPVHGKEAEKIYLDSYTLSNLFNHINHFRLQCGASYVEVAIWKRSSSDLIVYSIEGVASNLECLLSKKAKSDVSPKISQLVKTASKGDPIIYGSLFNKIESGDGPPRPEPEGIIIQDDEVLVFTAPMSEYGVKAINKFSNKYIIVAIAMSTHTRNFLLTTDLKSIRHLFDGHKVEVVDKEKLIFKVVGRKSYWKGGGAFWYDAIVDQTGKIIDIDNNVNPKHKACFSKEEFLKKSHIKLPASVKNEVCVER